MIQTEQLIEAILFHKAESMRKKELAKLLALDISEIERGISALKMNLQERGITLVEKEDKVMLRTSPESSQIIEKITKEDLSRDLGKAGLETLSIILYNNPISTREIEYVRGVKSSFILRNLSMRGLIERVPNPKDSRSYLYRPTFDTLGYLGISNINELPDYDQTRKELEEFAQQQDDTHTETA